MELFKCSRLLAFVLLTGWTPSFGQLSDVESESQVAGYVFRGVEAFKSFRKELCPVVGSSKKGLLLLTGKGEKRAGYGQSEVTLKSKLQVSSDFAELTDFDFSLANRSQERRENRLQAALDADIEFSQAKIDVIDSTNSTTVVGQPANMSKEDYRDDLQRGAESSQGMLDHGLMNVHQKADTIYISFELVPTRSVEGAYAAVVLSHDRIDGEGKATDRGAILSLERIGSLQQGVGNAVRFELSMSEQVIRRLEFRLYLFSGSGEPIATSASGVVKSVTPLELEALRSELP